MSTIAAGSTISKFSGLDQQNLVSWNAILGQPVGHRYTCKTSTCNHNITLLESVERLKNEINVSSNARTNDHS